MDIDSIYLSGAGLVSVVPCHWAQFPAPSPVWQLLILVIYFAIFVAAVSI